MSYKRQGRGFGGAGRGGVLRMCAVGGKGGAGGEGGGAGGWR